MTSIPITAPVSGWLCPLEEVPDPVFATGMLGDGVAIDPLADTVHAPAYGEVIALHDAGHAITLRLPGGVELLIHFGLDTVRLGGAGFTPLVHVGDNVMQGQALLRVDLEGVARGARSLVTPLIVTETNGYSLEWHAPYGQIEAGAPLATLTAPDAIVAPTAPGVQAAEAIRREVRVPLAHGLHARPSARLAKLAQEFDAVVCVENAGREGPLASPSAMLRLAIRHGDTIVLIGRGSQARDALDALAAMIESGMGEGAPFPAPASPRHAAHESAVTTGDEIIAPADGEQLHGVTAAPGLALGTVWRPNRPKPSITTTGSGEVAERTCLEASLSEVRARLKADVEADGSGPGAEILVAHLALLDDPELLAAANAGLARGLSAGAAWHESMMREADALRETGEERFIARAADFEDLDERVQWQILGQEPPVVTPPENAILFAGDLLPSQVASLDADRIAGIATALGGPTSHVAIIAAARGIPALVALGPRALAIAQGTPVILDASGGTLEVNPDAARLGEAAHRRSAHIARKAAALANAHRPAATADGVLVPVYANLARLEDVAPALAQGAQGCGLLRTEFLFLERPDAPDEDEQAETYSAIARALDGRTLIVRLLDVGGDKPAPYLPIDPEENPALGLRGIRVGLARQAVLRTQLRAILRASGAGDVRIMVPMVSRIAELREVRRLLQEEAAALGVDALPELGVMAETPAAAIMADVLAAECDFLSVGTNDLTQYTLAMDRGNPAVAGGLDGMDPAVLRLVRQICQGAKSQGKWVGVCGGLASDPLAVPVLIGLGVHELSASSGLVPEVKASLAAVTMAQCTQLAEAVLNVASARDVRELAGNLLEEVGL